MSDIQKLALKYPRKISGGVAVLEEIHGANY